MSITHLPKFRRSLLATGIACALAVGVAPVLPAMADTSYNDVVKIHQRELDPRLERIAVDTGRALTDSMHTALVHLSAGNVKLARAEVHKDLRLANVLDMVMPYTVITDKVTNAKNKVESQSWEAFQDDMVPIASDLDQMKVYAPQTAARAKQHLAEAQKQKKAGNNAGAKRNLQLVGDDIISGSAYLPVSFVRRELQTAADDLGQRQPNTAGAETALTSALNSVTVFVADVGFTESPSATAQKNTAQQQPKRQHKASRQSG